MGTSDNIYFLDDVASRIKCAAGHAQFKERFNTKDLENYVNTYYIIEDKLFHMKENEDTNETFIIEDNALKIISESICEFVPITQSITVYGSCHYCLPIILEKDLSSSFFDSIDERFVSCRWELFFKNGHLTQIEPLELETREELRARILKGGFENVLDDDDRIAKKHIKQLKENGTIR